jgi:hemolysin activation/secretion protein
MSFRTRVVLALLAAAAPAAAFAQSSAFAPWSSTSPQISQASQTEPDKVEGRFAVDNRGVAGLSRSEAQGEIDINSLLRPGDRTAFSVFSSIDGDGFFYWAAAHRTPIGDDGANVQLSYTHLRTHQASGLKGHADSVGLQFARPFRRDDNQSFALVFGLDGVNAVDAQFNQATAGDRSRAVRVSGVWSRQDGENRFDVTATGALGLDSLGARAGPASPSDLDFRKLDLRAEFAHAPAQGLFMRFKAAGQSTSDRLPGPEQFALGGGDFGRGYPIGVLSGDRGYALAGEFGFRRESGGGLFGGAELYAFADGGGVSVEARPLIPAASYRLASAGGGVRFPLGSKASLELEAAYALPNGTPALDYRAWRGVATLKATF